MRDFLARRRPSPAMAVAFLALLAALSGTAIALPGRNSVDSGDIKRGAVKRGDLGANAVTGAKVRNNSLNSADIEGLTGDDVANGGLSGEDVANGGLSGGDVADDSLTGGDINEASLGMVPNAAAAGSAGTVNGIALGGRVTVPVGSTTTLASRGPLSLRLSCEDDGGGGIVSRLLMTSSADNAAADAEFTGGEADELDAGASMEIASPGGPDQVFEQVGWSALTPSGQRFEGSGWTAANFGGASNCMAQVVVFG